ncbi:MULTISPECIES: S49 family peptidase [unclassified Mesorhizobium]|uniref:S49 family peptidase n=1 Tax=unclassified Mesorhizobium TaxID=325217 RepID=UPI000FE2A2D3|nr:MULTISPECIES: S49 family peptidase [unclassified Mesorhizobium]RWF33710.1 MAG: S49 family peptidase [Mesorhizobium sp.]RWX68915.1 S49 family peptidase [Mesorhizobium sp. M4B.F.Ca.ET.089.01.1.1]
MNPIIAQFQDQPALIDEAQGAWLQSMLVAVGERMGDIEKAAAAEKADDNFWYASDDWRAFLRPYVVKNGVLHVPVKGILLNDFPYAYGGYATGYEYIYQAVKRGVEDVNVKGIALVVNSGGGMVSGNFDLVDRIQAFRGKKPIRGFAAEHAYSAAYNIISATDHITVARTGGVGSIGVVVVALEYSKMLANAGITVNIIRSKPDKMEGNPYEKLSEGARERIQERVDAFHEQFVASVARNRDMSAEAVDATGARTFMAQQAIDNGLADEIGALDDAITAFEATFSEGDEQMADFTQAAYDEGCALALAKGKTEGLAEGIKQGTADAMARITAILGSDAGKARPKAALNAALKTTMSADEATAFIGELAEETATAATAGAPKGMLKDAMRNNGAGIEAGAEGEEDKTEMSRAAKTLAMVKG